MKTISMPILVLAILSVSFSGWQILAQPATVVVGGEYIIAAGQVLHGDLQAVFTQVTVQEGALVDGRISAVSSTLDLAGSVNGSVLALASDVTVRATARLLESPRRVRAIPFVILLPPLVRTRFVLLLPR